MWKHFLHKKVQQKSILAIVLLQKKTAVKLGIVKHAHMFQERTLGMLYLTNVKSNKWGLFHMKQPPKKDIQ